MTGALAAALRAHAAGLYPGEAGTELIISHGGFLDRPDFTRFIDHGISITDGVTPTAQIDWHAVVSALHAGRLPVSGSERPILKLAASLAGNRYITLRDTIPGLDDRNLALVITAIRHAAGHPPPRH